MYLDLLFYSVPNIASMLFIGLLAGHKLMPEIGITQVIW